MDDLLKIVLSAEGMKVHATHKIRSVAFDIASLFKDYIWLRGVDNTTIEYGPLDGYTLKEANTIIASSLALAKRGDFDITWGTTYGYLLQSAKVIAEEMGVVLLEDLFERVLIRYITSQSRKWLQDVFNNLPKNFNPGFAYVSLCNAIAAKQRLIAINPAESFITKAQWKKNLQVIDEKIDQIRSEHEAVIGLNVAQDILRDLANAVLANYSLTMGGITTHTELTRFYTTFMQTLDSLESTANDMSQTGRMYVEKHNALLREIELLCPAEKN